MFLRRVNLRSVVITPTDITPSVVIPSDVNVTACVLCPFNQRPVLGDIRNHCNAPFGQSSALLFAGHKAFFVPFFFALKLATKQFASHIQTALPFLGETAFLPKSGRRSIKRAQAPNFSPFHEASRNLRSYHLP